MDTIRDLNKLHPSFRVKAAALLNDIEAECNSATGALSGLEFVVLETLRPFARSDELYRQGRALQAGVWVVVDRSKVVTNAPGGSSFHNYGRALDGALKYKGKPFSWSFDRDERIMQGMRRIAELAKRHGIAWGGNFKTLIDLPHWQDASVTLADLRMAFPRGWQG